MQIMACATVLISKYLNSKNVWTNLGANILNVRLNGLLEQTMQVDGRVVRCLEYGGWAILSREPNKKMRNQPLGHDRGFPHRKILTAGGGDKSGILRNRVAGAGITTPALRAAPPRRKR